MTQPLMTHADVRVAALYEAVEIAEKTAREFQSNGVSADVAARRIKSRIAEAMEESMPVGES